MWHINATFQAMVSPYCPPYTKSSRGDHKVEGWGGWELIPVKQFHSLISHIVILVVCCTLFTFALLIMWRPWNVESTTPAASSVTGQPEQALPCADEFLQTPSGSAATPTCTRKRNASPLKSQTQRYMTNVYQFFKGNKHLTYEGLEASAECSEGTAIDLTSKAMGVPARTVRRYISRGASETPGKRRRRDRLSKVDDFSLDVVRRTVYDMYASHLIPSAKDILAEVRRRTANTDTPFPYSMTAFTCVLKNWVSSGKRMQKIAWC